MKLTYYGHSCFEVNVGGKRLLFDPFIRPNKLASAINVEELNPEVILISHGHWDHIADAVEIAKRTNALVISNFEIVEWLGKQGIKNTHPLNMGGGKTFDWGRVKMTYAIHSSALPDGSYGGSPGGFIIEGDKGTFFYSGDTALTLDFKILGEKHQIGLAILPIGDNFTMGIEDAVTCAKYLNCDRIMGVHYDTFPPIQINHQGAMNMCEQEGIELILMPVGSERDIL